MFFNIISFKHFMICTLHLNQGGDYILFSAISRTCGTLNVQFNFLNVIVYFSLLIDLPQCDKSMCTRQIIYIYTSNKQLKISFQSN